ncbi:restriction endonuclease subunit S [Bifidobacterium longum]|uniref:restriction endonuclease subunit S n=1 Tax=Bifidobacterium longum TaxID=216816 RepID=UPI003F65110F
MTEQAKVPAIRFAGFTDPWEQRKLGDVASSFDYGLNAAATEYDGQNKYLRITDIDDETHEFSKSDLTTPLADLAMSADYLLKESDLLFARTGASVGKTYLYRQFDGMVYFAGFLIRARIGEGADPEFAYQATLTDAYKKYVAITSQRSGQPGVNAQEYADYQLMLPSKTEQQQIGMTLRSLDDLITLHQRKYDKLVVFKKSMLEKMFPKDGESVPEIRFAGFTDPWEQRKLGEIVSIGAGAPPSAFSAGNFLYVKVDDLNESSHFQFDSAQRVDANTAVKPIRKGSIIFAKRGAAILGNKVRVLGKTAYIDTNMMALEPRGVDADFLWLFINQTGLYRIADTSTIPQINNKHIEPYPVDIPNMAEQQAIGTFFSRLDDLITLHQRKLELLQNIKKSLLDKMFV